MTIRNCVLIPVFGIKKRNVFGKSAIPYKAISCNISYPRSAETLSNARKARHMWSSENYSHSLARDKGVWRQYTSGMSDIDNKLCVTCTLGIRLSLFYSLPLSLSLSKSLSLFPIYLPLSLSISLSLFSFFSLRHS